MSETLRLRDGLSWRKVGDTIVILDLDSSLYLSLSGAATVIWDALSKGTTLQLIVDRLVDTFDIDAATARRDAATFVDDLQARKLLV